MERVNKHLALKEWVQEFLDGSNMYFENIADYVGSRSLVPNYGEFLVKTDVLGNKYKEYTFSFVGIEQLDSNDDTVNNANTLNEFDKFNDWVEQQEKDKNYPDFGENVSEYKVVPLQNFTNLALVDEQGNAKYILTCKLSYKESEE